MKMIRLGAGVFFLLCSLIALAGCETIKGTAIGARAVGKGFITDCKILWSATENTDAWIKKNLW